MLEDITEEFRDGLIEQIFERPDDPQVKIGDQYHEISPAVKADVLMDFRFYKTDNLQDIRDQFDLLHTDYAPVGVLDTGTSLQGLKKETLRRLQQEQDNLYWESLREWNAYFIDETKASLHKKFTRNKLAHAFYTWYFDVIKPEVVTSKKRVAFYKHDKEYTTLRSALFTIEDDSENPEHSDHMQDGNVLPPQEYKDKLYRLGRLHRNTFDVLVRKSITIAGIPYPLKAFYAKWMKRKKAFVRSEKPVMEDLEQEFGAFPPADHHNYVHLPSVTVKIVTPEIQYSSGGKGFFPMHDVYMKREKYALVELRDLKGQTMEGLLQYESWRGDKQVEENKAALGQLLHNPFSNNYDVWVRALDKEKQTLDVHLTIDRGGRGKARANNPVPGESKDMPVLVHA